VLRSTCAALALPSTAGQLADAQGTVATALAVAAQTGQPYSMPTSIASTATSSSRPAAPPTRPPPAARAAPIRDALSASPYAEAATPLVSSPRAITSAP
jgi:hypothetical protein